MGMADEPKGNVKLGAAVVGGYLLGRFKKGRSAMRLAAYLNGGQTPPQMLLGMGKQGAGQVMQNEQAKEIVDQLRGPLLEAIQKVVLAQVNSRVSGLSNKLESKTKELQSGVTDTAKGVTDTAEGAADTAKNTGKGLFRRGKRNGEEASNGEEVADQPEQQPPAEQTEQTGQAEQQTEQTEQTGQAEQTGSAGPAGPSGPEQQQLPEEQEQVTSG